MKTSALFSNQSSVPITALRIALDAEQWRSALNGAADGLSAELLVAGRSIPLPGLTFAASRSLPGGQIAGGATTRLTATATGLAIAPGSTVELRVSFNPGPSGGILPSDVFMNEFHYDNAGNDAGEFVEIAVGPGYGGSLANLSLVAYNGSNGATVGSPHTLDTFTAGQITTSGYRLFYKMIVGLQNESEGFAVLAGNTVLRFISYEGSFIATNGPALGMTATNIGVTQNGTGTIGQSALGLTGTGGLATDFTWTLLSGLPHSPGLPNQGQTFTVPAVPPQGLAIDNMSVVFLTDHDLDGLPDESDPDDDNDGQIDAYEVAFGTNPLNSSSRFLPLLARSAAPPQGFSMAFPGASGIRYTVQASTDLSTWSSLSSHLGNGQSIVVQLPTGSTRMFFRVTAGN